MEQEIIDLKNIYYKLQDDLYGYESFDSVGCLPDECHTSWGKTVLLHEKLGKLIHKFDKEF